MNELLAEMQPAFNIGKFYFDRIPPEILAKVENWVQKWGRDTTLAALRVVAVQYDEEDRRANASPPGGGAAGEAQMAASMWAKYVHDSIEYVQALPSTPSE